jgi:hypothetical protein
LDTNAVADTFRNEVNGIFQKTGLLFILTDEMMVERVIEYGVISTEIESATLTITDEGTRGLLDEAILLFKQPRPEEHRKATEKIWDALESLKTHFPGIENNKFDKKLANELVGGQTDIARIFEKELNELWNIGNNYSIRHFNNKQVSITEDRYYDYFFNRCLSLISTAIRYLQ